MFAPKPSGLNFSEFPCNVKSCIQYGTNIDCNGIQGKESCDEVMGSSSLKYGFCYDNPFNTYCACVNSIIPCPQRRNKYCTTAAYKPTKVDFCAQNNICSNVVDSYGEKNVSTGVIQTCHNTTPVFDPPFFEMFVLILFVSIVMYATLKIDAPIIQRIINFIKSY